MLGDLITYLCAAQNTDWGCKILVSVLCILPSVVVVLETCTALTVRKRSETQRRFSQGHQHREAHSFCFSLTYCILLWFNLQMCLCRTVFHWCSHKLDFPLIRVFWTIWNLKSKTLTRHSPGHPPTSGRQCSPAYCPPWAATSCSVAQMVFLLSLVMFLPPMGAAAPHVHRELPAASEPGERTQQRTGGKIGGGPCLPAKILVPATVGSPGTGSERTILQGRGQVDMMAGPNTPGGMCRPPARLRGEKAAAAAAVSIQRRPRSAPATIVAGDNSLQWGESISSTPGTAITQGTGGTATPPLLDGDHGALQKSKSVSQRQTAGGTTGLGNGQKINLPVIAH